MQFITIKSNVGCREWVVSKRNIRQSELDYENEGKWRFNRNMSSKQGCLIPREVL